MTALPVARAKSRITTASKGRVHWPYVILILFGLAGLYLAGRFAANLVVEHFGFHLYPRLEPMMHRLILLTIVCYIILIAIPFMPGVEIGLSLIAFLGPKISFLVYVSDRGPFGGPVAELESGMFMDQRQAGLLL